MNTANNLVYIVSSFLLSYMIISGASSVQNLRKIQVELEFPPEIFAQTKTIVTISIKNDKKFFPSFFLKVEFMGKGCFFPFVKPGQTKKAIITTTFPRRGSYKTLDLTLSSNFPFGFFNRLKVINYPQKIVVYPKPISCKDLTTTKGRLKSLSETRSKNSTIKDASYDEIISIRNYSQGDPIKFVNWKATAKTDKLKVNEMTGETSKEILLDLRNIPSHQIEYYLSCFTWAVIKLLKEGFAVGLIAEDVKIKPASGMAHYKKILEILANYGIEAP